MNGLYEFGSFRVDFGERLLLRDGQPVSLTPKAYETLAVLVSRPGHIVEKNELLRAVWPDSFVEEGNLSVTIHMLRKALGEGRDEQKYIQTVPKRGYRFVGGIQEVENGEATGSRSKSLCDEVAAGKMPASISLFPEVVTDHEGETADPDAGWRIGLGRFVLSLLFAGIVLIFVLFWLKERKEITAVGATASLPVRSVVVLPFKILASKSGDEYLGIGVADTLITKLGNTGQVVVRPTSAVLKYADSSLSAQSVGREQEVDAVLDGHIQREGEQLRVTVQLVRVNDGAQLWADTFDEHFNTIFALEDAISEKVAHVIQLQLTGEGKKLLIKHFTDNNEAYQAYVKGRYFWNKRTEEGLEKGAEYFRRAIALDPTYAQAYAGLADSYSMLNVYTGFSPKLAFPKAKVAATTALEIDKTTVEAHASLGVISLFYDWDGAAANDHFERTFEINPNYAIAHMWHGLSLAAMGRLSEASTEMQRAQEIDPLSLIINTNLGWPLYLKGQYDQAIEAYKKTIEMDPIEHCII